MLFFALLIAHLGIADSIPAATRAATASTADGAAIIVHRQPALPVVSLRLSIVASDPPGYAGVGHLIQHLLYPGLSDRVDRIGGRLQMQRTADAIAYTVTGPASELPYLAELLISTLDPPAASDDAILRAERQLREERLAEWETAPAHVRSTLRAQLFPADLSAAGTDRSATRFSGSSLPRIWAQLYRPTRVAVVAVGDVYLGDVQRAFAELPDPAPAGMREIVRDSVVLGSLAPAQATRAWIGRGYPALDLDPAAVSVTARLLGQLIRRRIPSAQVDAEHWWTHHGQAVALILAVPERDLEGARLALDSAVGSLEETVTFLDVVGAAAAIRREMLMFARTPDRMAEVIGEFHDREGDPNAAERFHADLESLDDRDVRSVLQRLARWDSAREFIAPQELQPRIRP